MITAKCVARIQEHWKPALRTSKAKRVRNILGRSSATVLAAGNANGRAELKILGIVTETHDAGLALLEDGVPVLVLEEERFNREKHTQEFPRLSLEVFFLLMRLPIRYILFPYTSPS